MRRFILVLMVMAMGITAHAVTECIEPSSSLSITNVWVSSGLAGKIIEKSDQNKITIAGGKIAVVAITNEDPTYAIYFGTVAAISQTANVATTNKGLGRDILLPYQTVIFNTNRDVWAIGPTAVAGQCHSTITVTTQYMKAW